MGWLRRGRLAVASAAGAATCCLALGAPAIAATRPPVRWGAALSNPYAADEQSARTYTKPWGRLGRQTVISISSVRPPLASLATLPAPTDSDSLLLRQTLNTSLRYGLTTWWKGHFASQKQPVLILGGVDGTHVRGPAMEAYAIAIALKTGSYDARTTGVPAATAQAMAIRIAGSVAKRHVSNQPDGWGRVWQSRLWTAIDGTAAWLLWDHLDAATRSAVVRMVTTEAHDLIGYHVPYYRSPDGTVNYPGDTKAEENSWDSMTLQLALAMMPSSPYAAAWSQKNVELLLSAFSRPQDLTDTSVIAGRPVNEWLRGSNANVDGTVTNHGIVHPDYMATLVQSLTAPPMAALAGTSAPAASLFNADVVYSDLSSLDFSSPPFLAPGGTIYIPSSAQLYYPQGNDWGTSRIAHMVAMDELAKDLSLDHEAAVPAAAELDRHLRLVAQMQARSSDGRSYISPSEDTFDLREEWVAYHLGLAWLSDWTASNRLIAIDNSSVFS